MVVFREPKNLQWKNLRTDFAIYGGVGDFANFYDLFSIFLLRLELLVKKEDSNEGYSINPMAIDSLRVFRRLNMPGNNPDFNEYVEHINFYGGQLLFLKRFNEEKKKEFEENAEMTTKEGKKIKLSELIAKSPKLKIPDGIACERFRMLRGGRIPYEEFEKSLREYGLLANEA